MIDDFRVSVIMPVYNAEDYLVDSVHSANRSREVSEIILIEDSSTDNSKNICIRLEEEINKVILHTHDVSENLGPGESRNLGIKKSTCPYIAFLDADDYYCENRFKRDREIFTSHPDADGVYNACGIDDKQLEDREYVGNDKMYTLSRVVSPDVLPYALLQLVPGASGSLHLNGLTVRKSLAEQAGPMSPDLPLHQDTEWINRLAWLGTLYPGALDKPVAMWRGHQSNRITDMSDRLKTRYDMYTEMSRWTAEHVNDPLPSLKLRMHKHDFHARMHKGIPALISRIRMRICQMGYRLLRMIRKHISLGRYPKLKYIE